MFELPVPQLKAHIAQIISTFSKSYIPVKASVRLTRFYRFGGQSWATGIRNFSVIKEVRSIKAETYKLELATQAKGKLHCQNCSTCIAICPHKVEILNLMRAYMYAQSYGNLIQAGTMIAEPPGEKGLNVCRSCSSCLAECRAGINIHSRLRSPIMDEFYLTKKLDLKRKRTDSFYFILNMESSKPVFTLTSSIVITEYSSPS
jgi:ferredoxin